jgi:DNA-binding CsgD family transcriptional regulator
MGKLGVKDLNDVLWVSRTALECNKVDELRNVVLGLLEKIFKTDKGNFFLTHSSGQLILDNVVKLAIEDKAINKYREYYYRLDPFFKRLILPSPIILTTEQLISYFDFEKSEYYNDFLKLQSIHYQMTISLRSTRQTLGLVALFRSRNEVNFSLQEKKKAELMAPYLASALEKTVVLKPTNPILPLTQSLKRFGISQRELDIIHLLCQGLENSEIANKLYISRYTVENHLKSIYEKLAIRNRTELVCKLHQLA